MSSYLNRLKQLDDEKFSQHSPDSEPTKPSKAPFVGFEGTGTGCNEKNIVEPDSPHFMWQVILPEGEVTVTNSPEATLSEMRQWYPLASEIEPNTYQAANEVSDF